MPRVLRAGWGRGAPSIRVGRAERAIARAAASHQSLSGGTPSWSEWSAGWSPPHEGQPEGLSPRRRRVAARRRAAEPRRGAPTGVTSGGWVRFEPKARGTDRGRRPSDRSRWHRRRTEPPKATTRRYRALCTMIRRREAPARGARGAESPRRAGKPARRPRGAAEPACEANRLACDGRPDAERRYGRSDSGVSGGGAPDHRRNRRAAAEPAEGGLAGHRKRPGRPCAGAAERQGSLRAAPGGGPLPRPTKPRAGPRGGWGVTLPGGVGQGPTAGGPKTRLGSRAGPWANRLRRHGARAAEGRECGPPSDEDRPHAAARAGGVLPSEARLSDRSGRPAP